MKKHNEIQQLRLREVQNSDCRLLWEWANDPAVRALSFSPEVISWDKHMEWLQAKISNPDCCHWMVEKLDGTPIGQVRGDLEGSLVVISITVEGSSRGKGYGTKIIRMASGKLLQAFQVDKLHAYIKTSNVASVCAFVKAGYRNNGITTREGHQAIHYILESRKKEDWN